MRDQPQCRSRYRSNAYNIVMDSGLMTFSSGRAAITMQGMSNWNNAATLIIVSNGGTIIKRLKSKQRVDIVLQNFVFLSPVKFAFISIAQLFYHDIYIYSFNSNLFLFEFAHSKKSINRDAFITIGPIKRPEFYECCLASCSWFRAPVNQMFATDKTFPLA